MLGLSNFYVSNSAVFENKQNFAINFLNEHTKAVLSHLIFMGFYATKNVRWQCILLNE